MTGGDVGSGILMVGNGEVGSVGTRVGSVGSSVGSVGSSVGSVGRVGSRPPVGDDGGDCCDCVGGDCVG
jgi:hypothetical protein